MLLHVRFQDLETLVAAGMLQHGGQVHSFVFFNCGDHLAKTYMQHSSDRVRLTLQKLEIYHPALCS